MTAHVVDEFLVLEKYRVMVLDRDVRCKPNARYKINGEILDPIRIHARTRTDAIPLNYIAVKGTRSFSGATIKFV